MSASNYEEALRRLLAHEGGYTDHPSDPGGPTNFGITLADYRRFVKSDAVTADMMAMKIGDAKSIYRKHYSDALQCNELPGGIDYAVFDYGVNSGTTRAGRVLRRVLSLPDDTSKVTDQVIMAARRRDASAVVQAICDERLAFLKQLKTWPIFGAGWSRRVAEVKALALAMASRTASPADDAAQDPRPSYAGTARKSAAAAVVIAAAGAAQQAYHSGVRIAAIVFILASAVLVLGGWLAWRRIKRTRHPAHA